MAEKIGRIGFGQVEPNHLSAQRTAQIYAQLPAKDDIDILENGQFVKYDYENHQVNFTGKGEWMLVFNEIKLYDERKQNYKDFALQRKNFTTDRYSFTIQNVKNIPGVSPVVGSGNTVSNVLVEHDGLSFPGQMVPRVFKTNIGDIMTTNTINVASKSDTYNTAVENAESLEDLQVGDKLIVGATGYLKKAAGSEEDTEMQWVIAEITTMPDGQKAVKIQRIH